MITPEIHNEEPPQQVVRPIDLPPLVPAETDGNSKSLLEWSNEVNPLHHVKTTVQVHVGSAIITVGQLLHAREGQVLKLDRGVRQAVDLVVEGRVIARGHLVAVDGYFAIRVIEPPVSFRLSDKNQ